jgi:uncharacterized protein YdeI (YjbR/CyaY-like superfamily)
MPSKDPRIDAYINAAEDFAKPVLKHLRKLVHQACPEVEETMKWQFPHFVYKGILCSMASFKNHCVLAFWKASLMKDPKKILQVTEKTAMGSLGKLTSLKDLPPDNVLLDYLREAVKMNEEGLKVPARSKPAAATKALPIPAAFLAALDKNKKAKAAFEKLSPSHRKEYIQWISEAKTEVTRDKRITTAIEWISEGKSRNWKYM